MTPPLCTSGSTRCSTTSRLSVMVSMKKSSLADGPHTTSSVRHTSLPRRHLAGHAHGGRVGCPARRVRSRLASGRGRKDVEVEAHRDYARTHHRYLRLGRISLLLSLGDQFRVGRVVLVGRSFRALSRGTCQRIRQPGLPYYHDDRTLL